MRRGSRAGLGSRMPPQPAKGRCACVSQRSPLGLVALAGCSRAGALAADPVFTEFTGGVAPGFSANGGPTGIALGPDGNVWMAEAAGSGPDREGDPGGRGDRVHRRGHAGLVRQPRADERRRGPDGNLWFTEYSPTRAGS